MRRQFQQSDAGRTGRLACEEALHQPAPGRGCRLWVPHLAALLLLASSASRAIQVEQTQWGFDGRVCPRTFTVLSVLVSNPTPEAFEGMVSLVRSNYQDEPVGARLLQPCVLAPYGSRWLQFYPRAPEMTSQKWQLEWGGRGGAKPSQAGIPAPKTGPPAEVYLAPPTAVTAVRVPFRSFPAALFPPVLGATEGLHAVILDHVPRWESARRRSFLDWLRSGGIVHLCQGTDGDLPQFSGDLSVLNSPLPRTALGEGLVVRHECPVGRLTPASLAAQGFAAPKMSSPQKNTGGMMPWFDNSILQRLSRCVVAAHHWGWLLLLTALYLVLLCPINYLIGRRYPHRCMVSMTFFAGTVLVFSGVFQAIGRRGYGESSSLFTISRAKPLGGSRYTVTQWCSAFVTHSDAYVFTHASPENLYATCQELEAVNGVIQNGRDGRFSVEMPLYSKRSFVHQGVMTGPSLEPRVLHWFEPGKATAVRIADLPAVRGAWLYRNGRFFTMHSDGNGVFLTDGGSQDTSHFLDPGKLAVQFTPRLFGMNPRPPRNTDEKILVTSTMKLLVKPLIADALGGAGLFTGYDTGGGKPSLGRGILFLFAESPKTFGAQGPEPIGRQIGYTLYQIPVHAPTPQGASNL